MPDLSKQRPDANLWRGFFLHCIVENVARLRHQSYGQTLVTRRDQAVPVLAA